MPKKTVAKLLKIYLMTYISGVHTPRNSSDDFVGMESMMESDVIVWFDAKICTCLLSTVSAPSTIPSE